MDTLKLAYTISEFCKFHSIGRNFFYKLQREGRGPQVSHLGAKKLITAEAAKLWREKIMEQRDKR